MSIIIEVIEGVIAEVLKKKNHRSKMESLMLTPHQPTKTLYLTSLQFQPLQPYDL